MKNLRGILLQIIDVVDIIPWMEEEIEDFLVMTELEAMLDLIEELPKDKRQPMINRIIARIIAMPKKTPDDLELMFSHYYTRRQMKEALTARTKKAIAKNVVEPHREELSPAQCDSILALLNRLT